LSPLCDGGVYTLRIGIVGDETRHGITSVWTP
jgi:hypothetical protein